MGTEIHRTAIVDPKAVLGEGTTVGPYCVIGPRVVLGRGNKLGSHVVLDGHTTIGDENQFFPFSSIGSLPQDLKYRGEDSTVVIGNRNSIREYVTIQPGTAGGGMSTTVGDGNLFMVSSHVAHDSHVGSGNVVANGVALAGHVTLGNGAILGGLCGIHQFVRVGDNAMIGAGAMVDRDIPPASIAQGDRARLVGINVIGLGRKGCTEDSIARLKKVFREICLSSIPLEQRLAAAEEIAGADPLSSQFIRFVRESERGIAPSRRSTEGESSNS